MISVLEFLSTLVVACYFILNVVILFVVFGGFSSAGSSSASGPNRAEGAVLVLWILLFGTLLAAVIAVEFVTEGLNLSEETGTSRSSDALLALAGVILVALTAQAVGYWFGTRFEATFVIIGVSGSAAWGLLWLASRRIEAREERRLLPEP